LAFQSIFQIGQAAGIKPGGEARHLTFLVAFLQITFPAVGYAGFRAGGAGLVDKDPDTQGIFLF